MKRLRELLWVYLLLLVFEGALRKWIVPALDAPLLIIRDPLVMWIYYEAYRNRLSFQNGFLLPNIVLAIATTLTATFFGQANLAVTVYGLRTDYLQIPLIFLIPQILNRDDVIAMGRFFLYATIPVAFLVLWQFRSPQDSFINKGALNTWYGTVRPSGPFSFVSGLVAFFSQSASFLFFGLIQLRTYKAWLMGVVTVGLIGATFCSGSRSCVVTIGIVVVVAIMCVVTRGKGGQGMIIAAVLIAAVVPILSSLSIFHDGAYQLTERFGDAASTGEDTSGFVSRYAGTMVGPLEAMGDTPAFGYGLGIGTNAAAGMLHGTREFIGAEDEWGRLIFECGPILGVLLCLFRVTLTIAIARSAFAAFRNDNVLPMLIFSACGLLVLNGQWGVPTLLGFAVFGGGLTLAACVEPPEEEEYDDEEYSDEEGEQTGEESDHSTATDSVG